jgi:hypothetical protein
MITASYEQESDQTHRRPQIVCRWSLQALLYAWNDMRVASRPIQNQVGLSMSGRIRKGSVGRLQMRVFLQTRREITKGSLRNMLIYQECCSAESLCNFNRYFAHFLRNLYAWEHKSTDIRYGEQALEQAYTATTANSLNITSIPVLFLFFVERHNIMQSFVYFSR